MVDGVVEVTKQLEKQAIEDKEKDEDGEDGEYVTLKKIAMSFPSVNLFSKWLIVCVFIYSDGDDGENAAGKKKKKKKKKKGRKRTMFLCITAACSL